MKNRSLVSSSPLSHSYVRYIRNTNSNLIKQYRNVAGLSKLLRICELFGASHDMIFNQKKSASVYFISRTLKGAHLPNMYLNGEVILQVDSVKYLGHHLTNDLHDDLDIR